MKWFQAVARVRPYLVKIETPGGHGSGFLCLYNESKSLCGIATAFHVISQADKWQQPIRIIHEDSQIMFVKDDRRIILNDFKNDSAVILFDPTELELPQKLLPLLPFDRTLKVGADVGWLGYPSVAPNTLCFFSGNISSCRLDDDASETYFIDGVAINGVSGGPVFTLPTGGGSPRIVGTISAYYPNNAAGRSLPGLAFAQGVTHFHNTIKELKTFEEARKKRQEQERDQETLFPPTAEPNEG
ncbi:MAG: trypsin-like peptidase domain-containing protein, partial [Candidatus Aquilonibacter sp.]